MKRFRKISAFGNSFLTAWCLAGTVILFAGCEATFKNSDQQIAEKRSPAASSNVPTTNPAATNYTSAFDANLAGGGTSGTSTSFRVMGGNLSSMQKVNGTSTSYRVRGGIMGQYGQ